MPKISILLPTHNRADVLPFAIQSVLVQTVQDFELLVVGDGCTDNTAEVIQEFDDSRIRWFDLPKAPNFGYANRNIVLRQARGDFIAFMAHDDLWLSDHLEVSLPVFEDKNIEIAYSRPLWVIPRGLIVPGLSNLEFGPTLRAFLNERKNEIPASCFIHRRDCLAKYGYWNENLSAAGDHDMWARIIRGGDGQNFTYLATPTTLHFKANWHTNTYDELFGFNFWRKLFLIKGLMPDDLKIPVIGNETEQNAVWKVMSADSAEWNKNLRKAIQVVLDVRVAHSNKLMESIFMEYEEGVAYDVSGFDASKFFKPLIRLAERDETAEKELKLIKSSFLWKTRGIIMDFEPFRITLQSIRARMKKFF